MIHAYFSAERTGGLTLAIVGVLAVCVAICGWHQGAFWRGAAWSLTIVALLQMGIGVTIWLRSPKDQARVLHMVVRQQAGIANQEIPRMQTVMKNFVIYRWAEAVFVLAGLLLAVITVRGGTWQGVGAGLAVQAGLVLLLDSLAAWRGQAYLEWLQTL